MVVEVRHAHRGLDQVQLASDLPDRFVRRAAQLEDFSPAFRREAQSGVAWRSAGTRRLTYAKQGIRMKRGGGAKSNDNLVPSGAP